MLGSTHPAVGRGSAAGQPFPLGEAPGRRIERRVPPIPPEILRRIFSDDAARNRFAAVHPAPSWGQIALCALAVVAFVLFVFWLNESSTQAVLIR